MPNVSTIHRTEMSASPRLLANAISRKAKHQGNPLTLAAIREAKEGKMTGVVDTSSLERFIQTCSE